MEEYRVQISGKPDTIFQSVSINEIIKADDQTAMVHIAVQRGLSAINPDRIRNLTRAELNDPHNWEIKIISQTRQ